jgi:hypothetical protein
MWALTFWAEQSIVAPPAPGGLPNHRVIQLGCDLWYAVEEAAMVLRFTRTALIGLLSVLGFTALPSVAQQPAAGTKVMQITGLTGVKAKTSGSLTLENGNLQFASSEAKASVPIHSVEDVITGNDSQRVFRGTFGTLTMFAPYGGGRFLSLFRSKLDTLTIQYRDADGGLHGAIFTMLVGKADPLKKELVLQGAHTSIPIPDNPSSSEVKPDAAKEKKP